MSGHTIDLCISPEPVNGKIAGGDLAGWADLYRNLVPVQLDIFGIADAVYKGHVIAPVLDGWRSYDHFVSGQFIGIDIDTENKQAAISTLVDHDLVQMYGALIYSTPSSTPTAPRSRVVFLLDEPITDPYRYKAAIRTLSRYFPGYDKSSAEPTRTFFGNMKLARSHNTDGIFIPNDSYLPLSDLRRMYAAQQKIDAKHRRPAPDYTGTDLNTQKMLESVIRKAAPGHRNNICYWMSCRMVEGGVPRQEQEEVIRQFVTAMGGDFDEAEGMACLESARTGRARQ